MGGNPETRICCPRSKQRHSLCASKIDLIRESLEDFVICKGPTARTFCISLKLENKKIIKMRWRKPYLLLDMNKLCNLYSWNIIINKVRATYTWGSDQ